MSITRTRTNLLPPLSPPIGYKENRTISNKQNNFVYFPQTEKKMSRQEQNLPETEASTATQIYYENHLTPEEKRIFLMNQNHAAMNKNKQIALHLAAKEGFVDVVKCQLSNGADINQQDTDGNTALHFAAQTSNFSLVEYLLSCQGIKANLQNKDGNTALHLAVCQNNFYNVYFLIASEKVNADIRNLNQKWAMELTTNAPILSIFHFFALIQPVQFKINF